MPVSLWSVSAMRFVVVRHAEATRTKNARLTR